LILRPYQAKLKTDVQLAWAQGARNVLMRLGTGGGKTVVLADLIQGHNGASAIIAHRHELVSQLSLTLAKAGVRHNIIGSAVTRRQIIALHIQELGRSFFDPGSRCAVASVDTLIRADGLEAWAAQVTLWIVDEAHHVVEDNKWHVCLERFIHPACRGLGPTATPSRADGKGLGAHADGVFHTMVQGPPERWLIEEGYLTNYKIVCPTSDLEVLTEVGESGDWSTKKLREAAERSHIVGDVVEHYQRWGAGKLGITFSTDIETAGEMTEAYRRAGIRAETLTGKTDPTYRVQILKQFAARKIAVIVAVDIISEGFDLPAVDVLSMARPTQSLGLYMQQFGRALRPIYASGYDLDTRDGRLAAIANGPKPYARIIDHVANVIRHQGPPDKPRVWTLDGRDRKSGGGGIPLRVCVGCFQPYERFHTSCPWCGCDPPAPEGRSSPGAVDGDLAELDAETLAKLRGDVAAMDQRPEDYAAQLTANRVPPQGIAGHTNRLVANQRAQALLRAAMEDFVRARLADGLRDRAIHKLFFLTFGVDVLSARALKEADAIQLRERIINHG
jgi:DNA repair protein RadD